MSIADIVAVHVTLGTISILSGSAALFFRKGDGPHRAAGTVFFLAMLGMCAAALPVAVVKQQYVNVAAASFTLYLVATAWKAAVRKDGQTGSFETVAFLAGASVAAVALTYGATIAKDEAPFFYVFGGLAALATMMDASVIARGGVSGVQRIARHLWRMCLAMFVATGSFFLGQQKVMPEFMLGSPVLIALALAPLVVMIFWLVRVFLTNWHNRAGDVLRVPEPAHTE
jgi:uncharacterized membrane protein